MKRKWLYLVLTLLWFAAAALSAIQGRAWPAVALPAVAGVLFGAWPWAITSVNSGAKRAERP